MDVNFSGLQKLYLRVSQKYTYFAPKFHFFPFPLGWEHVWLDSVPCWPDWETSYPNFYKYKDRCKKIR